MYIKKVIYYYNKGSFIDNKCPTIYLYEEHRNEIAINVALVPQELWYIYDMVMRHLDLVMTI